MKQRWIFVWHQIFKVLCWNWISVTVTSSIFSSIVDSIVWFKKTVTHLLLYTVANVSPFFWIRLYFIRSWRKISEPKHRTVDHISEPKHRTVDHGGFLKQITKIDSFYNQSFFIFKFSALAEKNMICNMFCKDEIFTVWHSERYKKANLNSKWA